jgi:phosphoserine phosphatase
MHNGCIGLVAPLGRLERVRELDKVASERELRAARKDMAGWYQGIPCTQLIAVLEQATWAPGTRAGIRLLQEHGVAVAIASITWEFAVVCVVRQLEIAHYLGTRLQPSGEIHHVWPRDKARWLQHLVADLGIPSRNVAAVGDSAGDVELLLTATHAFYVGPRCPTASCRSRTCPMLTSRRSPDGFSTCSRVPKQKTADGTTAPLSLLGMRY